MKKFFTIISLCFCLNLRATEILYLLKDFPTQTKSASLYVSNELLTTLPVTIKSSLLNDIVCALSDKVIFDQVCLALQRNRRGQFLFPKHKQGIVASILLAIERIKKYPSFEQSHGALDFMILGLTDIEDDKESLDALGITDEQRQRFIKTAEALSESLSSSSHSEEY